jgi:hypothetical protein
LFSLFAACSFFSLFFPLLSPLLSSLSFSSGSLSVGERFKEAVSNHMGSCCSTKISVIAHSKHYLPDNRVANSFDYKTTSLFSTSSPKNNARSPSKQQLNQRRPSLSLNDELELYQSQQLEEKLSMLISRLKYHGPPIFITDWLLIGMIVSCVWCSTLCFLCLLCVSS